jgi:CheY-like chemotaxis protein
VLDRHRGRIWAHHSTLGGAAFSFTLPVVRGDRRVLVVDDDDETQTLYATVFESALNGRRVIVSRATSLAEARDLLGDGSSRIYDAVVLSSQLPDGSGTELLDHLGRHEIPVHLVTSASDQDRHLGEARARGVSVSSRQDLVRDVHALREELLGG